MKLMLERRASPLGEILLVSDDEGQLRALDFHDYAPRMHLLLRRHYGPYQLSEGSVVAAITDRLDGYFAGNLAALDAVPVATRGTDFQRRVWAALRTIPFGETTTYGALATRMGKPSASRATGLANGANPIAIVVPCHRVIGASGALTGYAGGIQRKHWLLRHEGVKV